MAAIPGPRKLVLIDSGVYPYAEIDLEESVHLSGRNNAGKSSLLNALQFLYIDDIKLMHFPTSNFQGKTKPFYFKPGGRSSILVEADTKWGIRTVGFHGLGAASGCDWQRFGFDGPYHKDDFIDPASSQPRTWDAVRARLAPRGYVELSQAQLRAALRGSGGERGGFRLELVPGGGSYDTFIEVFRQLLTLRKSRPDDLKNLLISVVEPELVSGDERNRGTVALGSVVGEDYASAHAGNLRYEKIRAAEKIGLNLFGDYDRLRTLQEQLPRTLRRVYREAVARLADRKARAQEAQEAAEAASEAESQWNQTRRGLDQEFKAQVQELGRTKGRVEDAQVLEQRLQAEPKEMQEARLLDLRQEAGQVRMDLSAFQGAMDGSAALRARVARHRHDRQTCLVTIDRLRALDQPGARPAWMEILEEYPDEERGPLLRLVNPAILTLPEGPGGLEITDPRSFGRMLSVVSAAAQGGVFEGAGLRVNLEALPAPGLSLEDPTVRAREIENYETQAQHLEREIKRLEDLADNSRGREKLMESLAALEEQERALSLTLSKIASWEEEVGELPALAARLAELEASSARLDEAREEALSQHESCRTRARVEANRAAALTREAQELRESILGDLEQRALPLGLDLSPDELTPDAPELTDLGFKDALGRMAEEWTESMRLDQSVARRMEELDLQLDGMIAGDRDTRIQQIRDLIEGLPDQKAQLDAAWQHIAVIAKTSFSNLLRDYDTLSARVARLNRAMARFSVSNLSGIQLRLVENLARTTVLKQFTQEEGLFADQGLAEQARDQMGEWIRQGEVFRLFDLFRVELEVSKDGEKEVYASLDAESTGTAITLKVVFLAHLLRDLYRSRNEVRLLIFVDEVDTLDDMNQETIRQCAQELGFTLIMASPNPANARRLYFLRPEGKVTYIYPEESLEVVFRDEPSEP
ncbi:MAG: hypothetical protein P4L36_10910 [Holophaga sp.]|nr:hypothetical protein [Holophaga sp.]